MVSISFGFTLNNLTSETKVFELSADLVTQDMFAYYANGNQDMSQLELDVATTALEANVSWTADGQVVNSAGEMAKCDFDGDGDVDTDDGQALTVLAVSSADFADINHDRRWIPMMYTCSLASWVRTPLRFRPTDLSSSR